MPSGLVLACVVFQKSYLHSVEEAAWPSGLVLAFVVFQKSWIQVLHSATSWICS